MEEFQKKHRQEQKDLQPRITQKKKSATKKSCKGVNDECAELERQLKERQQDEVATVNGIDTEISQGTDALEMPEEISISQRQMNDLSIFVKSTSISDKHVTNRNVKKLNRQKARLARRAAEQEAATAQAEKEAADLPNLREQERKSMRNAYTARDLTEYEIRSYEHCLYAAIADQLQSTGIGLKPRFDIDSLSSLSEPASENAAYSVTRQVAAAYISQNSKDFEPFVEEPIPDYVKTIRETGEWGGHLEILALAKAYHIDVNVLQGSGKIERSNVVLATLIKSGLYTIAIALALGSITTHYARPNYLHFISGASAF